LTLKYVFPTDRYRQNTTILPGKTGFLFQTMKKVNCITINTDASFNTQLKIGGYAFYIVCDLFKIQKGGKFKTQPAHPTYAEMMCIGNAIATLLAQKELPECNWIIINSDSTSAMSMIKSRKSELGEKIFVLLQLLKTRTQTKKVEFRHVKAHNGKPDSRSWVNDWCDKEAKKWMKKAVKEYKLLNDNLNI